MSKIWWVLEWPRDLPAKEVIKFYKHHSGQCLVFVYCWVSLIGMILLVILTVLPDQHWVDRLNSVSLRTKKVYKGV